MHSSSSVRTATVLGKRKASLILHLESSPEPSHTQSESEYSDLNAKNASSSSRKAGTPFILVNGSLVAASTKKRYRCTYEDCDKAYSKPVRLTEHERSHTGTRPFKCGQCLKSFLRETHLQAHLRSHQPESARPLVCSEDGCERRFWTPQQLGNHEKLHRGVKPFPCPETACTEAFSKHHQLREHVCSVHAPPGTKPFQCDHEGCGMSFDTKQHLRTHTKVHNEKRYTCSHAICLTDGTEPAYFQTWTALQHHTRTVHPPACSHPACHGRTFSSQHNLRAHQKIHEQRDLEAELGGGSDVEDAEDNDNPRPRKKRRGGEIGRDWKCSFEGCTKAFKSERTLKTHTDVKHLNRRDHVCSHENCGRAFGYKHLLQRHVAKTHSRQTSSDYSDSEGAADEDNQKEFNIDDLTGASYAAKASTRVNTGKAVRCPYPQFDDAHILVYSVSADMEHTNFEADQYDSQLVLVKDDDAVCDFVFGRAYDLRRHLKAVHGIEAEKESVEAWMKKHK